MRESRWTACRQAPSRHGKVGGICGALRIGVIWFVDTEDPVLCRRNVPCSPCKWPGMP
jgi:hypothetical protein